MAAVGEKSLDDRKAMGSRSADLETIQPPSSVRQGISSTVHDDPGIRDFYQDAVTESYRLKSELVAQHLAEIGMGK